MHARSTARLLGYDAELLERLPSAHQQALSALSGGWLLSCLLLGLPLGVAVYKTEHGAILALVMGIGAACTALNALRLVIAGSGAAAHLPLPSDYRPALTTGIIIGGLALLMSQPAQLLLASPAADAAVDAHRAELIAIHRQLLASMGGPLHDGFAERTADCEFVVLRLALLWAMPIRNVLYSGTYALLVLAPFLLSRTLHLPAIRSYERLRHRRAVMAAAAAERETRAATHAALRTYPTFSAAPADLGERGLQ